MFGFGRGGVGVLNRLHFGEILKLLTIFLDWIFYEILYDRNSMIVRKPQNSSNSLFNLPLSPKDQEDQFSPLITQKENFVNGKKFNSENTKIFNVVEERRCFYYTTPHGIKKNTIFLRHFGNCPNTMEILKFLTFLMSKAQGENFYLVIDLKSTGIPRAI